MNVNKKSKNILIIFYVYYEKILKAEFIKIHSLTIVLFKLRQPIAVSFNKVIAQGFDFI